MEDLAAVVIHLLKVKFGKLTSLMEQLSMARVHPILADAFVHYALGKYQDVAEEQLPRDHKDRLLFLQLCGANMRSLDLAVDTTVSLEAVQQHCTKLEKLRVAGETALAMQQILTKMPTIKILEVYNASHLDDSFFLSLQALPNLRELTLQNFPKYRANLNLKLLKHLHQLEKLKVDCLLNADHVISHMQQLRILAICKSSKPLKCCPQLEKLDIFLPKPFDCTLNNKLCHLKQLQIRVPKNMNEWFPYFLKNLIRLYKNQLESLSILGYTLSRADAHKLRSMQKLKELSCRLNSPQCLKSFAQLKQLEGLSIANSRFSDADLLNLLQHCPQMRYLNVCQCTSVTNALVDGVLAMLRQKPAHPEQQPFALYAGGTDILVDNFVEPKLMNIFFHQPEPIDFNG